MKVQVGVSSVVTCSIMKICPLEINEGNQNIMTVPHGRRERTGEIFVMDIFGHFLGHLHHG